MWLFARDLKQLFFESNIIRRMLVVLHFIVCNFISSGSGRGREDFLRVYEIGRLGLTNLIETKFTFQDNSLSFIAKPVELNNECAIRNNCGLFARR